MKNRSVISLFALILVIFGLFAACSDSSSSGPSNSNPPNSNPPNSNYTVNFEANGGDPVPDSQNIVHGEKVVPPSAMAKTGYGFGGWYKERACTNQWDFADDTVTGNITLYAKWDTNYYTVDFEANDGSPAPDPQDITHGGTVIQPPAMTKTGYGFGGWYKEAGCTNEWNFTSDTVNDDITLYAKWDVNYHTVKFNTNGGSPVPNSQSITHHGMVVQPPAMTKTGYGFGGWYKEAACTNEWNFATDTVTDNITLYAQWNPINTLAAKLQWLSTNAVSNSTYMLEVTADEDLAPQKLSYSGKNNITIHLKGIENTKVITLSGNGSLFSIEKGVTLILDENLTLQGKDSNNNSLFQVNVDGTLIMNQNVKITGNTSSSGSGGVYVNSGTFTMNGGEVSGNTSPFGSGGVYVNSGTFTGTFTMNGGKVSGNISGNISSAGHGGVYVVRGIFTMNDGEISGNIVFDGRGGGVSVDGGTFTMKGGKIFNNSVVQGNGGGVSVDGGTFTMSGGEISGNTALNGSGGGVEVASFFDFNSNNSTATLLHGTFTKTGGTITGNNTTNGNKAANSGHAVAAVHNNRGVISCTKYKNTTAGPGDNLSCVGGATPVVTGVWDN